MPKRLLTYASALFACAAALAARVDEKTALTAASAFVSDDCVGSAVLPGRGVSRVEPWGSLWVARLEPSGHVVIAGSDGSAPIVAFSASDFTEPDPRSPRYALLRRASDRDASDAAVASAVAGKKPSLLLCTSSLADALSDSLGGERLSGRRAKWASLTNAAARAAAGAKARRALLGSAQSVVVEPFMTTSWSQWQPYNDFAPVWDATAMKADGGFEVYRGRSPSGCLATAGAQVMRYWQWPARIDGSTAATLQFSQDGRHYSDFRIRFDGNVPFDWSAFDDFYDDCLDGYDLRGKVPESVRYPVARLVMLCGILSETSYDPDAGSSVYNQFAKGASPWYEVGRDVSPGEDYEGAAAAIRASIERGEPVMVTVPDHVVIGHGWAEDDASQYIYLNYGWGGDSDGYYNLDDTDASRSGTAIGEVRLGFVPHKTVQIDPLPAVVGDSAALSWHLPRCYRSEVGRYLVRTYRMSDETSSFSDDFSAVTGMSSDPDVVYPAKGRLALLSASESGAYSFPDEFVATTGTELSYRVFSAYAYGYAVKVQLSCDGADWTTVSSPPLNMETDGGAWTTHSVSLAGYAGKRIRARIQYAFSGLEYYEECRLYVDDFAIAGVHAMEPVASISIPADGDAFTATRLECGSLYSFTVTPVMADGTEGMESSPVYARSSDAEMSGGPQIVSVTPFGPSTVADGIYLECAMGNNVIRVKCSGETVSLEAHASHQTLIPDGAIKVHDEGEGSFAVEVDASGIPAAMGRTRAILTLKASDANGSSAYRDLVLRFSPEVAAQLYSHDIAYARIEYGDCDFTYSGSPCEPSVDSVVWGGVRLAEGRDYTVTYANNVDAGQATVTVAGTNMFAGSLSRSFAIAPKELADDMVGPIESLLYLGAAVMPEPEVVDAERNAELARGSDYTLSWSDNLAPGTGRVTVAGRGNYTGSVTREFAIAARDPGTLAVGEYFYMTIADLGYGVPTDGTAYSVVAKGLPPGLKLRYNAAVKDRKGRVVTKAKSKWWIEGVPTAALDFMTNPPYLVVAANGSTRTLPLRLEVLAQDVKYLDDLALGKSVNRQFFLPGVTNGWSVAGLPPGLKYTAKLLTTEKKSGRKTIVATNALPYTVYGKTTKAGLFTVTAKKKRGSYYETRRFKVLVTPKAVNTSVFGPSLTNITTMAYVPVAWHLTNDIAAAGGKVAKVTGLPAGLSFAAANKYAYRNTKKRTGKYLKQAAQTIVGTPTKAGTYVVTFTKNVKSGAKTVAKSSQILWVVKPNDVQLSLDLNQDGGVIAGATAGLAYADLLSFTATEGAKVTATGLPAGISLADLGSGSWAFKGYTTKAGTYLVSVTVSLRGRSARQRIALKVEGLPQWAKGTFKGYTLLGGDLDASGETEDSIAGRATLTVSSVGRISGKFQELGTNWTFSASCYAKCEDTHEAYSVPVTAVHSYRAKSRGKTVTRKIKRPFSLVVSPGDRGGMAVLEEDVDSASAESQGTSVYAWQNL